MRDRNALQHTATHCNILQLRGERQTQWRETDVLNTKDAASHCNTLQHTVIRDSDTATHCNTPQHTATHCNTLQHTATHRDTRKTHCRTLQHTAKHWARCNAPWYETETLQHTARHCNALQRTVVWEKNTVATPTWTHRKNVRHLQLQNGEFRCSCGVLRSFFSECWARFWIVHQVRRGLRCLDQR